MVLLRCLVVLSLALTALGAQQRPVDSLLSDAGALVQAGRLEEAEAATRKIITSHLSLIHI